MASVLESWLVVSTELRTTEVMSAGWRVTSAVLVVRVVMIAVVSVIVVAHRIPDQGTNSGTDKSGDWVTTENRPD